MKEGVLTVSPPNQFNIKKALHVGLFIYAVFMGIGGTVSFATLLFWITPKNEWGEVLAPIGVMAFLLYSTCAIALFIRSKIKLDKD
ncbi:MAG: hypothetical protein ACQET8_22125 [Bacillota bacterium]